MRFSRSHVLKPVSRFLTGACIEDVNHEIHGGLYSQMIFGESFQEPSAQPIDGFILVVNNAAAGADRIDGLEVSLDPGAKSLRVARHHQDYHLLVDAPCEIATKQWIKLRVFCHDGTTDFTINQKKVTSLELPDDFKVGAFGVRTWERPAQFKNLLFGNGDKTVSGVLKPATENVSGMWTMIHRGDVIGAAALADKQPSVGSQSQTLTFTSGTGEFGIENRGLNHQGKPHGKKR